MFVDLHVHSKHARGTSKDLDLENMEKYAKIKGIDLLGTGDFTHPIWINELKKLREENGILYSENNFPLLLQTEISLIYSQGGKGRRVHNIVLAPNIEVVEQIIHELGKRGRLDYDGRPIFNISCIEFVDILRRISDKIEIIPAHIWTPWFSMFGSMSGFDSIKDAFGDNTKHIHAIETGLSSDPPMNWRLSQLDKMNIVSFSDAHSFWPWRIGREMTELTCKLDYKEIIHSLRTGEKLEGTIEVDPAYGKYHWDGHRNCNVRIDPENVKDTICPKCGKSLTIGVLRRVNELADREMGYRPKNAKEFKSLIPLSEIISTVMDKGIATNTVWALYNKLVENFGNEMNILLKIQREELLRIIDERLVNAIIMNREGKIHISPGYDGEYGIPVFDKQKKLADF